MRGTFDVSEAWTQAAVRPEPHVRRHLVPAISNLKSRIADFKFQIPNPDLRAHSGIPTPWETQLQYSDATYYRPGGRMSTSIRRTGVPRHLRGACTRWRAFGRGCIISAFSPLPGVGEGAGVSGSCWRGAPLTRPSATLSPKGRGLTECRAKQRCLLIAGGPR